MIFGEVRLEDAEGAILGHTLAAIDVLNGSGPAYRINKGTVLNRSHLNDLRANGHESIVVARLERGDVTEDDAAARLAEAVVTGKTGLHRSLPAAGRVNLKAEHAGIVTIDRAAIEAANRVHPGITIATVLPFRRLPPGGLAATIKIIPLAVPGAALEVACDHARGAMGLLTKRFSTASLIETCMSVSEPALKGRRSTEARLARLGVSLSRRILCDHDPGAVADALASAPGDVLLILTGSATADMDDVAPSAVRRAGGEVLHFGMPVDPGNLLFLGQIGRKPVIGLPGCARSPALNGADWVLERVLCGAPIGPEEIMGMGVGGLLKEIPERGRARDLEPWRQFSRAEGSPEGDG